MATQSSSSTTTAFVTPTIAAPTVGVPTCNNCGIEEHQLLHNVHHHGSFHRLCTTCVLHLHPESFCPSCFIVYERIPWFSSVTCHKCGSYTHREHTDVTSTPQEKQYICLSCLNPKNIIFNLENAKDSSDESQGYRAIDFKASKLLYAAAKIASISMNKEAARLKAEAEQKAAEAASSKQEAQEALKELARLVDEEKNKIKIEDN